MSGLGYLPVPAMPDFEERAKRFRESFNPPFLPPKHRPMIWEWVNAAACALIVGLIGVAIMGLVH